jgi:hypothetical protein
MIKIQHQGCFSQAVSGEGKEYAFATVAEEFQNPNSAMFCSSVPLWSVLLISQYFFDLMTVLHCYCTIDVICRSVVAAKCFNTR